MKLPCSLLHSGPNCDDDFFKCVDTLWTNRMTDENDKQRLRVKQLLISGLPGFIELRRNQEQVYQVATWRLTTACCRLTCSYELM